MTTTTEPLSADVRVMSHLVCKQWRTLRSALFRCSCLGLQSLWDAISDSILMINFSRSLLFLLPCMWDWSSDLFRDNLRLVRFIPPNHNLYDSALRNLPESLSKDKESSLSKDKESSFISTFVKGDLNPMGLLRPWFPRYINLYRSFMKADRSLNLLIMGPF